MPTRTRTRDGGSGLAKRLAQRLSRRRALLARQEVETRLNRVPCHHGIFVELGSISYGCEAIHVNHPQSTKPASSHADPLPAFRLRFT